MPKTIYIPERHAETDRGVILDFIEQYSFAMLVTGSPSVQITNLPTLLFNRSAAKPSLWFHLAKANPQNEALLQGEAVAVFHGPHGYISPNWYQTPNAVPTWNFATIHVSGRAKRIDDDGAVAAGLRRLVQKNEAYYAGAAGQPAKWQYDGLPESYLRGMRQGIIAYEMPLDQVEAKFKLGQERNTPDREGTLLGLANAPKEPSLLDLTREYYKKRTSGK